MLKLSVISRHRSIIVFFLTVIFLLFFSVPVFSHAAPRFLDTGDELVIVIDPGHGGENEGTNTSAVLEKYRTLVTAQAMYEELLKYDGVKVYMTRTDDVDMSLKERAEFAASVGADYLFSLHYNASEEHAIYGTEIWIPATFPYIDHGYQFAEVWLGEMSAMGLHNRGVKTRIKNNGEEYYGVIREGKERGITTVILEHCHLDASQDETFCDTEEKERAFGRADATAAAKYFGLRSTVLGVDYSGTELAQPALPDLGILPLTFSTAPETCELELTEQDEESGEVTFQINAADSNELLEYYEYSLDGGESWQGITTWPGYAYNASSSQKNATLKLTLSRETDTEVRVRVYNYYDQKTESAPVTVHFKYMDEQAAAALEWEQAHSGDEGIPQSDDPDAGDDPDIPDSEGNVTADDMGISDGGAYEIEGNGNTDNPAIADDSQPEQNRNDRLIILIAIGVGSVATIIVIVISLRKKEQEEKKRKH
jgi:N-acetylmuramoyl-L-alanine amidase